jgi:hypothetical protein
MKLPDGVRLRVGYPPWLRLFLMRDVAAITLGRRIWVREALPEREMEILLRHELVHVRQMRELGVGRFLLRYVREYVANRRRGLGHDAAYRAISFESEAFAAESDL